MQRREQRRRRQTNSSSGRSRGGGSARRLWAPSSRRCRSTRRTRSTRRNSDGSQCSRPSAWRHRKTPSGCSPIRAVDLKANLLFFRDMYESATAVHGIRVDRLAGVRGTLSRRVCRLHLDYLVQQQADVDAKLALLRKPATECQLARTPDSRSACKGHPSSNAASGLSM